MHITIPSAVLAAFAAFASAQTKPEAPVNPLQKKLEEYKAEFLKKAPPEMAKVFDDVVEEVRKSGIVEQALKVGDTAPDFQLPNAKGEKVKLAELTAKGPVVLVWYRGGWCPYCNLQLAAFRELLPEFTKAGATLAAISPETPDSASATANKGEIPFEVLSDQGNKVAREFKLIYKLPAAVAEKFKGRVDLKKFNGDDSNELPLAATYVIDRKGVIRYAFLDADYRKRAEPNDVLAAVKALAK